MPSERQTGTVAKWLNHKGIGFITPEGMDSEQGKDILVHYMQIQQESEDGFKSLEQGSTVEYDLESDPKNEEKQIAVNVTGPNGEDCKPKKKGAPKGSGKSKGKGKGKKGKGKRSKNDGEAAAEE